MRGKEKRNMNKVVLVMNDPMFCLNYHLAKSHRHIITKEERWFCGIGHGGDYGDWVYELIDIDSETRPDWCPLRPVPTKYDTDNTPYNLDYNEDCKKFLNTEALI